MKKKTFEINHLQDDIKNPVAPNLNLGEPIGSRAARIGRSVVAVYRGPHTLPGKRSLLPTPEERAEAAGKAQEIEQWYTEAYSDKGNVIWRDGFLAAKGRAERELHDARIAGSKLTPRLLAWEKWMSNLAGGTK